MVEKDSDDPIVQVGYVLRNNRTLGVLTISMGADDEKRQDGGAIMSPPLAVWWANSTGPRFTTARSIQSDMGGNQIFGMSQEFHFSLPASPLPEAVVSRTNRITTIPDQAGSAQVTLSKELPMSIHANLGFGQSALDLTGMRLTSLNVETAASKSSIKLLAPNPQQMTTCTINAGLGECRLEGLANLNAQKFVFSGGLGYYQLGFGGKLPRDLDASVSVGLGKCSINIPPECGRVQIFYEDTFFSSFDFRGLTKRRDGYYTSVGFEHSTAPILTLRLSSGMGKMIVNYR